MEPFRSLALSLNDAEEGAVKFKFAFGAVKLYDPSGISAANVAAMFPFVEAAVMFKQYTQSTETPPFTVVNLTIVELRLSILTPPFTFDTWTVLKRIVDGTNTLMFAV